MVTYEIKNYIKLLCIRIDHFESFLVAEENTDSLGKVDEFIERYDNRPGLKIVMVQMNNMEIITFDDVKKIIKNAHIFDYIRHLSSEGHKMLKLNDIDKLDMRWLLNHMLSSDL